MTNLSKKMMGIIGSLLMLLCGCGSSQMAYKSYTNDDFYKDGVFQRDVAKKAVKQLIQKSGLQYTKSVDRNLWVCDFGLGDYEHVGLASVTWVNDPEYGYFAMTMYLLPGQMIPELYTSLSPKLLHERRNTSRGESLRAMCIISRK